MSAPVVMDLVIFTTFDLSCHIQMTATSSSNPKKGMNSHQLDGQIEEVYTGHWKRFYVPADLTKATVDEIIERLDPLTDRIENGFSEHWNGRDYVACYDDDAKAALKEAEELVDYYCWEIGDRANIWRAGEIVNEFFDVSDIDPNASDADLEKLVPALEEFAISNQIVVNGCLLDALDAKRMAAEEYAQQLAEELAADDPT
jgi:hypothetical protein